MCLNRLRLVVVTNSLSECSIIVCLAMKTLWIWIATFWLHIVSSCYKVGWYAWPLWNFLFGFDCLESHKSFDWHTLTKCSSGVHCRKVILFFCFLWSASMFLGCLPQCPIYAVTGKVLSGWPLLPCVYNDRITINILYFSPDPVVSRCLLKLQRPLS